MANNLGVKSIHVESDSEEAINLIMEDNTYDKPLMRLILDCTKLLLAFKRFKLRHVFQGANAVANILPKEVIDLEDSFRVILNPPSLETLKLLLFDGEVCKLFRLVHNRAS